MINKQGQAAMEFLMTYGWAILAAIIVIGVLASFGIFNQPLYHSPESFCGSHNLTFYEYYPTKICIFIENDSIVSAREIIKINSKWYFITK